MSRSQVQILVTAHLLYKQFGIIERERVKTFFTNLFLCLLLGVFSAPSAPQEEFVFNVAKQDQKKIYEMITIIGSTSTGMLLFKKGRLDELRGELNHVPPLQFFAYIFSTPPLVKQMEKIQGNSMKYKPFVSGSKPGLYKEYQSGSLNQQIEGFAQYISVDPQGLKKVINTCMVNCSSANQDPCLRPFFDYLISQAKRAQSSGVRPSSSESIREENF